jgi:hypothetical protein
MPKEPPVERFKISCDVEAEKLGPTVAQLTKLGLTNVHFELIEDVRTFAKKVVHETSSEELLLAFIKDHPTFKAVEACRYFEENGRAKNNAYPALGTLVEKKILKKLDPGNYARADIKHLEGPKKKPKDPRASQNRYEVPHSDFILKIGRQSHGRFSAAKVKERFIKDGRNPDSVSNAIHALQERKQIKRVSEGEYVLLNGMTEAPKTNGNGTAEAAHG